MTNDKTKIQIRRSTAITLKELKLYKRETYDDVIIRLIKFYKKGNKNVREG
ncbi:MAG: hypothetical protein ACTSPD_15280 [Promethearchaeota archaeon]